MVEDVVMVTTRMGRATMAAVGSCLAGMVVAGWQVVAGWSVVVGDGGSAADWR